MEPITRRQLDAIRYAVGRKLGMAPWNNSDAKVIAWLNEHRYGLFDDLRKLTKEQASYLLTQLNGRTP